MDFKTRQEKTDKFFKLCESVLNNKGQDYTIDGEAFREVKEIALEVGISPEKVLWIYARKHYTAIKNYIHKGKLESEPIAMRLVDLANYLALLSALIEEKNESQQSKD